MATRPVETGVRRQLNVYTFFGEKRRDGLRDVGRSVGWLVNFVCNVGRSVGLLCRFDSIEDIACK